MTRFRERNAVPPHDEVDDVALPASGETWEMPITLDDEQAEMVVIMKWDTLENQKGVARTVAADDAETDAIVGHIPEHLFAKPQLIAPRQSLERILGVLVQDERFLASWLGCSFAHGEGDALSDLDVHVTVADERALDEPIRRRNRRRVR
jgi:hypothetical protein